MTKLALSRHAQSRIRQRGLRDGEVDFLVQMATPVADDAWLLTEADASREIARRKHEIETIQRLRGCVVVVVARTVVTAYHADQQERRRALRRSRELR